MTIPWITAVNAERTICETTSDTRLTDVGRKRGITSRSRSLTIAIPLHVAPKRKAVMITIAGVRKVMYDAVRKPPLGRCVTRLNSCP